MSKMTKKQRQKFQTSATVQNQTFHKDRLPLGHSQHRLPRGSRNYYNANVEFDLYRDSEENLKKAQPN